MFAINTKSIVKKENCIVYILLIELEDKQLVKVGVTCRDKVEDRVSEILISVWKRYRWFPRLYVKRYRVFKDAYSIEKELHSKLEEYRYSTKYEFSGSTEIFDVELDIVVDMYEDLYKVDKE